jgi:hypothetical protein
MSLFVLASLVLAFSIIVIYLVTAAYKKKRPELNDAVIILIGTGGAVSATRIIGFVLTGQFSRLIAAPSDPGIWSLVPDDAGLIAIGGLALALVSIQTIFESFKKVRAPLPLLRSAYEVAEEIEEGRVQGEVLRYPSDAPSHSVAHNS